MKIHKFSLSEHAPGVALLRWMEEHLFVDGFPNAAGVTNEDMLHFVAQYPPRDILEACRDMRFCVKGEGTLPILSITFDARMNEYSVHIRVGEHGYVWWDYELVQETEYPVLNAGVDTYMCTIRPDMSHKVEGARKAILQFAATRTGQVTHMSQCSPQKVAETLLAAKAVVKSVLASVTE